MKRLFITGIPTSGKSYLACKLAAAVGGTAVILDDFRESLAKDERYSKWVSFYLNQDELAYYTNTKPDDQWRSLVAQSDALWPAMKKKIAEYAYDPKPVIFECVNLLPHLTKRELDFPGVVLIGSSFEEVRKRNNQEPRWGDTKELQKLEAESFFNVERPRYKAEAEKYGYPVFETADEAYTNALELLK